MTRQKRTFRALLLLVLIGALSVAAVYHVPLAVSQLTYAVEKGKAAVSREQLATAVGLSDAFKHVAEISTAICRQRQLCETH